MNENEGAAPGHKKVQEVLHSIGAKNNPYPEPSCREREGECAHCSCSIYLERNPYNPLEWIGYVADA